MRTTCSQSCWKQEAFCAGALRLIPSYDFCRCSNTCTATRCCRCRSVQQRGGGRQQDSASCSNMQHGAAAALSQPVAVGGIRPGLGLRGCIGVCDTGCCVLHHAAIAAPCNSNVTRCTGPRAGAAPCRVAVTPACRSVQRLRRSRRIVASRRLDRGGCRDATALQRCTPLLHGAMFSVENCCKFV